MMNENDYVEVVLTKYGAEILNAFRRDMSERTGIAQDADFSEDSFFKCQFHELLLIFGGSKYNVCGPVKFKDINFRP